MAPVEPESGGRRPAGPLPAIQGGRHLQAQGAGGLSIPGHRGDRAGQPIRRPPEMPGVPIGLPDGYFRGYRDRGPEGSEVLAVVPTSGRPGSNVHIHIAVKDLK